MGVDTTFKVGGLMVTARKAHENFLSRTLAKLCIKINNLLL